VKRFDSINIIPFVDVMLVLLAIILTTSTLVQKHIIPIDLPQSGSEKSIIKKSVIVTIKNDGTLLYDEHYIEPNQLDEKLSALDKQTPISLNCDKESAFKHFVMVLNTLKKQELTNLSIITKDE